MENKHILFVLYKKNNSITMIVPTKTFLKARQEDYDKLKEYSVKMSCCVDKKTFTVIDNSIIMPIVNNLNNENNMSNVLTPVTKIYYELLAYANCELGPGEYYKFFDKEWHDSAITTKCALKNHIESYVKCVNSAKSLNVSFSDTFMFLEKEISLKDFFSHYYGNVFDYDCLKTMKLTNDSKNEIST